MGNNLSKKTIGHSEKVRRRGRKGNLSVFASQVIMQLEQLGKIRTAETYRSALNSFMEFRKDKDVLLKKMDADLMLEYEACLKAKGVTMNTVSFYMRILRAVYNRAVERGLTVQHYPFRHVYTGVGKTVKRAVPLTDIRQIKMLDLCQRPVLAFARDLFLFSFYTRGMSFVDMAYLRKKDLQDGVLTYHRRKTGQRLSVKWEECMQEIVDKYSAGNEACPYLLPIIKCPYERERSQYKASLSVTNRRLKEIARLVGLRSNLTMYVARHSWASIARSRNIPLSVISEGMGHDSEMTTRIYLASLETSVVDQANNMILELL